MKYAVLVIAFLLPDTLYAGALCDDNSKNRGIVKKPPQDFYVKFGTDAFLQWTYCKTQKGSITGIIISRQYSRRNPIYLLSMDVTGKVTYYQTTREHHSIKWKKENGTITFIIKDLSINDAGGYILVIRREGYIDLEDLVNVFVSSAVSPGQSTIRSKYIPITKTSILMSSTYSSAYSSSTVKLSDHKSSSAEISFTHYLSHATELNKKKSKSISVLTTTHNGEVSSKISNVIVMSKKAVKDTNEEDDVVVIILICVLAGMAPIALVLITIGIYKLGRRRNKRRKKDDRIHVATIIQTQERNLTTQREDSGNGEFDYSFSASSMSGFSYRDSLEPSDVNEQEPPSSITFGIDQSRTPITCHNFPTTTITTRDIIQDANCPLLPKRKNYELKRELIQNMEIVGEGAFGLVARAILFQRNDQCIVAVKMLKDFATNEDRRDLISECNLMRRIDSHKNVVELLGFVLQSEPIWVVTEYAAHGDLRGFLRKSRGIEDSVYHGVSTYCGSSLTQEQLLKMAKDIACGMAYLAQNKIIHRDLAARNILVDENICCKITDFGMARDVKSTNYYRTRNRGRIPFKWTAIEAILYDKYTTMSDVWSYGVVIYEIVTIGGSPYPRIGPREILRRLKRGWRMEKPSHVSTELYSVMLNCWATNPEERPTFSVLSGLFGTILGTPSEYINVEEYKDIIKNIRVSSSETSNESCNEIIV